MATTTAAPPTEALAKKPMSLMEMLKKSESQIAMALPRHLTVERMVRVAITAVQKTPMLQKCSPTSIVGCVIQASQLGLEPDGILGQAYMVPYWNSKTGCFEAQLQPGYRGLITLARRSGEVSSIYAELVFACDKFEVAYGTEKKLVHKPDLDNAERGSYDAQRDEWKIALRGAYAVVKYKDGESDFEYMSKPQMDRIREAALEKTKGTGPWATHPDEMFRKCPIRRLAKRLPLSPEFMKAAVIDEYADTGITTAASEVVDDLDAAAATAGMKAEQELAAKLEREKHAEAERQAEQARLDKEKQVKAWHQALIQSGACAAGTDDLGYCKLPKGHANGHQMVPVLSALDQAPAEATQDAQQPAQEAPAQEELASPAIEFGNGPQAATQEQETRPQPTRQRRRY